MPVVSQPPALCFSSSIDDIVFQPSNGYCRVTLDVVYNSLRINVLTEKMYRRPDGRIVLSSLSQLLEPYVRRYMSLSMECSFEYEGSSVSITPVTLIYAAADVGTTATLFTTNHFLTLLDGVKITSLLRQERLYAYGASTAAVSAEVRLPEGTYTTLTGTLTAAATVNNISQFDVSPRTIVDLVELVGGRLLAYTVTAGSRKQEFRVEAEQSQPEPSLLFVNSFGVEEFLHCAGTLKQSSKVDRQSSRFSGKLKNYHITEERQFTANTGWLNDAMADWANDLLLSDEVYLWQDGALGKEIVITDSKNEINNEDDYLTSYELTYTYAQRINNVMKKRRVARIFSDTFEGIYN